MKQSSFHILRVGMAITFLWIGVLILQNPDSWGGYLLPWASALLPISVKTAMLLVAAIDIAIGFLLLVNYLTFHAAAAAALHLAIILAVSGINPITVRDIGLLAGTLALAFSSYPYAKQRDS